MDLFVSSPEFQPLAALLFGVVVGWAVQSVSSRLRYNGSWEEIPRSKRRAMSATGSIAAFVVGLWILDHPRPMAEQPFVYRLWLWQTVAAWLGSVALDAAGRVLSGMMRERGSGDGS